MSPYPIHWATGLPMAPCTLCERLSGLVGVAGGECLACMGGFDVDDQMLDQAQPRLADEEAER